MWCRLPFFVQVQVPVLAMCRDAVCGTSDRQTVRRDKRARCSPFTRERA